MPRGMGQDLATPLTINGLARALLEPPLALSLLLSQLYVLTNARHKLTHQQEKRLLRAVFGEGSWEAEGDGEYGSQFFSA